MSVQTGTETPSGPRSRRMGDRMKYRVDLLTAAPNPLWVREMRQSARLVRTPIVLMILTILMVMLMASLGGALTGTNKSPSDVGTILFHTYFSIAWFVVTLVGPALAANSIASEREGKTWEAVLLTGMRPAEVARGKFFSAYTAIAMYVVMLAPVGALPFLFGGVTPVEVFIAFIYLFLIASLSVAFGLAISAKMESLRGALLVTLLVATPLSTFCFWVFGVGGSQVVHAMWDAIQEGGPVWLPTAYSRAPFGLEYVVFLLLIPPAAVALPAWLLYEITRANLTSVTDDRSYGLKKWFMVAALVTVAIAAIPLFTVEARQRAIGLMLGSSCFCFFVVFNAFLFGGEHIGPSRRVKAMLATKGAIRRWLSPGVMRAAQLQLGVAWLGIAGLCGSGVTFVTIQGGPYVALQTEQLITFSAYAVAFSTFVIGLAAFLRARSTSPAVPRVLLLMTLFFLFTGPWILAAITGVFAGPSSSRFDASLAVAAPSPFYLIIAVEALTMPDPGIAVVAAMGAAGVYALLGFGFLVGAHVRTKGIIDEHEAILGEADRRLAEEDELARAAALEGSTQEPHESHVDASAASRAPAEVVAATPETPVRADASTEADARAEADASGVEPMAQAAQDTPPAETEEPQTATDAEAEAGGKDPDTGE